MDFHEAKKYLHDVPEGYEFHTVNGFLLHNLKDLRDFLKTVPEDVFHHHVTSERNDFVNWVRDVIQDELLAQHLSNVQSTKDTYEIVKNRIEELKEVLHAHYLDHMKHLEKRPKKQTHKEQIIAKESNDQKISPAVVSHARAHSVSHSENSYQRKEREMERYYKHIIVKEFFYGMASGIILALILLRMIHLFH